MLWVHPANGQWRLAPLLQAPWDPCAASRDPAGSGAAAQWCQGAAMRRSGKGAEKQRGDREAAGTRANTAPPFSGLLPVVLCCRQPLGDKLTLQRRGFDLNMGQGESINPPPTSMHHAPKLDQLVLERGGPPLVVDLGTASVFGGWAGCHPPLGPGSGDGGPPGVTASLPPSLCSEPGSVRPSSSCCGEALPQGTPAWSSLSPTGLRRSPRLPGRRRSS